MAPKGIDQYKNVSVGSDIDDASPHRLIQMLLEGALEAIASAKGHMQQENRAGQGEAINKAITIVSHLQDALDKEQGGEIAENLEQLYFRINQTLLEANMTFSQEKLDEAIELLITIKKGWDAIPTEHHQTTALPEEAFKGE